MSDLREAIESAMRKAGRSESTVELLSDELMPVVEAYLREHTPPYGMPDDSPGDVIHAEPDGTIVLDDGITTWNPRRAHAWLLREGVRSDRERIRQRIEAIPTAITQPGRPSGTRWVDDYKRDVLEAIDSD